LATEETGDFTSKFKKKKMLKHLSIYIFNFHMGCSVFHIDAQLEESMAKAMLL